MLITAQSDPTIATPMHGFRGDAESVLVKPRGMTVAITREAGARGGRSTSSSARAVVSRFR